jgi:hypothetical protein
MSPNTEIPTPQTPNVRRGFLGSTRQRIAAVALAGATIAGGFVVLTRKGGGDHQSTPNKITQRMPDDSTTTSEEFIPGETSTTEVAMVETTHPGVRTETTAKNKAPATSVTAEREKSPSGYPWPETLPGYGVEASPEMANQLRSAQFVLGEQAEGSDDWILYGNTTKVNRNGEELVEASAHDFAEHNEYNLRYQSGGSDKIETTDIVPGAKKKFALFAPEMLGAGKVQNNRTKIAPVAFLNHMVISITDGVDAAIGSVDPTTTTERYESAQALARAPFAAQPGNGVALLGAPSPYFAPIEAKGTYLGTVKVFQNGSHVSVVGVKGNFSKDQNPCAHGSSGGASVYGNSLSGGRSTTNTIDGTEPIDDDPRDQRYKVRKEIEDTLQIDTSEYPTLCLDWQVNESQLQQLRDGFNKQVPPDK